MMKRRVFETTVFTLALTAGVAGSGCGSSSTPAAATLTSASAGLATAQSNLQTYTPATKDNNATAFNFRSGLHHFASLLFPEALATSYTPFGSLWTNSDMPDLYCDNGHCTSNSESLQNYMGQMIDPTFLNAGQSAVGAAGRFASALFQTCAMMHFVSTSCAMDSDGLPSVGTCSATVSLNSMPGVGQTFEGCIVPASVANQSAGTLSLNITVSAVSGNANYNKKIVLSGAPVGSGTGTSTMYAKLDSSAGVFNIENISPGDNQTNNTACGGSRYILAINGSVTQFEYSSITLANDVSTTCASAGSNSREDFYRIHLDTGADQGYILGMSGVNNGTALGLTFILSGKPSKIATTSGSISASIWSGDGTAIPAGATTFDAASADACVTQSSGSISSDGSLACDITGLDIASSETMLAARQTTDFNLTTVPTSNLGTPAPIAWTGPSDFATAQTAH